MNKVQADDQDYAIEVVLSMIVASEDDNVMRYIQGELLVTFSGPDCILRARGEDHSYLMIINHVSIH